MCSNRSTHWAKTHQDSHETEPRRDMELRDSSQDQTWTRRDWAETETCKYVSRDETRVSRLHHWPLLNSKGTDLYEFRVNRLRCKTFASVINNVSPSVLSRCWLDDRKGTRPVEKSLHQQSANVILRMIFSGPGLASLMTFPRDLKDCTFSVVVRSSLGDRNCTTLQLLSACGHRLSALLPFLLVSRCAVPLQCLWHESVTLISTCLMVIIITWKDLRKIGRLNRNHYYYHHYYYYY